MAPRYLPSLSSIKQRNNYLKYCRICWPKVQDCRTLPTGMFKFPLSTPIEPRRLISLRIIVRRDVSNSHGLSSGGRVSGIASPRLCRVTKFTEKVQFLINLQKWLFRRSDFAKLTRKSLCCTFCCTSSCKIQIEVIPTKEYFLKGLDALYRQDTVLRSWIQ